jgi:hypothetical protein
VRLGMRREHETEIMGHRAVVYGINRPRMDARSTLSPA